MAVRLTFRLRPSRGLTYDRVCEMLSLPPSNLGETEESISPATSEEG